MIIITITIITIITIIIMIIIIIIIIRIHDLLNIFVIAKAIVIAGAVVHHSRAQLQRVATTNTPT